jgi:hypothetical protein
VIVSGGLRGLRPGKRKRHAAPPKRIVDIPDAAIATGERRAGLRIEQ